LPFSDPPLTPPSGGEAPVVMLYFKETNMNKETQRVNNPPDKRWRLWIYSDGVFETHNFYTIWGAIVGSKELPKGRPWRILDLEKDEFNIVASSCTD
jgi:hypothetical protein